MVQWLQVPFHKSNNRKNSNRGFLGYIVCFLSGACLMYVNCAMFITDSSLIPPSTSALAMALALEGKPPQPIPGAAAAAVQTSDSFVGPSSKSLHPKWKLWHEMTVVQQEEALKEVMPYIEKYGKLLRNGHKWQGDTKHGSCSLHKFGVGNGHQLCDPPPDPKNCNFFSFGINNDPSFDREIATEWGCRGFAGDPTVNLDSRLHPKVTFHNLGATMLMKNEEQINDKGTSEEWWSTSMPSLRRFLTLDRVEIIKLDCEGCEVAFARDILAEDPTFLSKVDQISIETHVTRAWINSTEHLYYFALQFPLLEEAGHVLEWSSIFGCSKRHEEPGCLPELNASAWPCGYKKARSQKGGTFTKGISCQDFLWKRYPSE